MMRVLAVLLFVRAALASIQFTIASGSCSGAGVFSSCNDSNVGAMCGYVADEDKTWCCKPEVATCGDWGETCTGSGNLAGSGQIFCQNSDATVKWCCNAKYETCGVANPADFNLCSTNFENPYANTTIEEALSMKSAYFATASSTAAANTLAPASTGLAVQTTSRSQSSSQSGTTAAASIPTSSEDASPTGIPNKSSTSSHALPIAAKVGIAFAAVSGATLIAVISFILGRKFIRSPQNSALGTPYSQLGVFAPPDSAQFSNTATKHSLNRVSEIGGGSLHSYDGALLRNELLGDSTISMELAGGDIPRRKFADNSTGMRSRHELP